MQKPRHITPLCAGARSLCRYVPLLPPLGTPPFRSCRLRPSAIAAKRCAMQWEAFMARRNVPFQAAFLASSMWAWPAMAADVTPDRLMNADKEPQNWLMNHRTYDGQRFSPLARINRDNVKNLKLAYAVPLGGGAGNEFSV